MSALSILIERNRTFASSFAHGDMKALPKLGLAVLGCIDARVDPAHILGLELGDAVVIRNNGGRVSRAVIDELTVLAALAAKLTGSDEAGFHLLLMQHTQCGAQAFADPAFQAMLKDKAGIDVSEQAITNQESDLLTDIARLRDAASLPGAITVSAMLYDVATGQAREISPPQSLASLREVDQALELS